jgi:hypothetical protein
MGTKNTKLTNSEIGARIFAILILSIIVGMFFSPKNINTDETPSETDNQKITNSVSPSNEIKKCLVGFDWVYPNSSNIRNAWMFSSDGTFNFSTKMFGGMSAWGQWEVIGPEKIKIRYTKNTQGTIQNDQELTLSGCNSLRVGTTIYIKD